VYNNVNVLYNKLKKKLNQINNKLTMTK